MAISVSQKVITRDGLHIYGCSTEASMHMDATYADATASPDGIHMYNGPV